MSSTYTTYVGSVSFTATTDGWAEPATSAVDVIGFPGGDAIAISIAGQRDMHRSFTALFTTAATYRLFRDMRSKAGYLQVENWDSSPVRAILISTTPQPPQADGQVLCAASFILY